MLNDYQRERGIPLLFYINPFNSSFLLINSQHFNAIYDLIRLCKFSIISLKEGSFDIRSSTFFIE
jgi:hypothetical protein